MRTTIPSDFLSYMASRRTSPLGEEEEGHQALTPRAFLIGIFLSLFLSIGAPYGNMIIRGSYMSLDFSTPGAIFLFFILVGLLNMIFKLASRNLAVAIGALAVVGFPYLYLYWPFTALDLYSPALILSTFLVLAFSINVLLTAKGHSLALNRSELILVYIMLLIVSALCTMGLGEQLVPMVTALFYYAKPGNKWAETLFPHASKRILVNDGANNKAFFEGLSGPGEHIPYGAWVEPMLYWGIFLLSLYVTMVCLAVIFRRQWMERERLAYPIAQVPLAMIRGEREDTLVNRFFKSPAMWIGLSIPLLVGSLLALHRYYPSVFTVPLRWSFRAMRNTQTVHLYVSFAMLGFSYLINSDIAAGLWVFHLLSKIQKGIFVMAGVKSDQVLIYGVSDFPYLAYQGLGALFVMVGVGLWVGREHLKNVFLKALGRGDLDDSDEILSYRSAMFGALGGIGVMVIWLCVVGVPLWVAVAFVIVAMVIFTAMTRIVAEAGIAAVRPPMIAPNALMNGLGSRLVGPASVMNLSIAYIWAADIRVFLMANCTNGLKLIEGMDRRSRRYIFWAILVAIVIGAMGSSWVILQLAYKHGGINLNGWFFGGNPGAAFSNAQRNMEPTGVYKPGLLFTAIGGLVMGLFMWLRQRLLWWPVHPVGFVVGANYMMDFVWFNVFLAWLVKTVILKYGGGELYRRSQVFFLGLIAGQALVNGMWLVIDYFTGKIGNALFWI